MFVCVSRQGRAEEEGLHAERREEGRGERREEGRGERREGERKEDEEEDHQKNGTTARKTPTTRPNVTQPQPPTLDTLSNAVFCS